MSLHCLKGRPVFASFLLLALLLRASIPVGFMPSGEGAFALKVCPEGLSPTLAGHSHHDHAGSHLQFEHCSFGSAPAAAPISHHISPPTPLLVAGETAPQFGLPPLSAASWRAQQARAPPVSSIAIS
jgi:hypothetical protein